MELATSVAERAAELLAQGARSVGTNVETKSSGTDMVTELDRASEDLIVTALLEARPSDAILAEESGARPGSSGVRWVVDPLDGTTNYLYGYPSWSVSIAAEANSVAENDAGATVGGDVIVGVVVDAALGEVFTATAGGGAYRNGEPIACSTQSELSQALVATGFAYAAARRRAQAEVLVEVLPRVRDIRRGGSAAIDLCSVACGRVDAFFERGLRWWDLAAGALVAREAGAVVSSLGDTGDPGTGTIVAAAPTMANPLRALLDTVSARGAP